MQSTTVIIQHCSAESTTHCGAFWVSDQATALQFQLLRQKISRTHKILIIRRATLLFPWMRLR